MAYDYCIEVTRLAEDVASGDWCEEIGITTERRRDWDTISDRVLRYARRNGWVEDGEPQVHVVRVYEDGVLIENHATDTGYSDVDEYEDYREIEEINDLVNELCYERESVYEW